MNPALIRWTQKISSHNKSSRIPEPPLLSERNILKKDETMRKIALFIILIALQACASRLPVSEDQAKILQQLSDTKANKIIEQIISRNDEQSGLFASNGSPFQSDPKIIKFEDGVVVYADYEEHVNGIKTSGSAYSASGVGVNISYDHTMEEFKIDLRKIKTIAIVSPWALDQRFINSTDGVQLGLLEENGNFVNLDIKKEYFDEAIAAIKYYSPEAEIKSGSGL
ncbi:hypothetical protein [Microbulbifer sp. SAOS-129_SWC]|uniref:hypothetical protein n=1 Tax=Microbulbifer sp. SAOS-129_SWC TaxID=3145235 RepID=UPI003217D542